MLTPIDFALALMTYCNVSDASVTSWGRTIKHNKAVGGHPISYHTTWQAADVIYDEPIPIHRRQQLARHLGLELTVEDDHDHLEPLA